MRVLFFGRLADVAGKRERQAPALETIAALRAWIDAEDAVLGEALRGKGVRIALNKSIVHDENASLSEGDEIAFMPPLSGG
ncbi:MAG: MoaD/ThiS family protein [Caulobacterales bacterium]